VKTVLLLHQREILHYRVAVYNRLSVLLRKEGWKLVVVAQRVAADCPHQVEFELVEVVRRTGQVIAAIREVDPDAVILFVNASEPYLFPVLFWLKWRRIAAIYWGHGIDLEDKQSKLKRMVYAFEHSLCNALILYSERLTEFVAPRHHHKTFIARNTIDTSTLRPTGRSRQEILRELRIPTRRNIICVGRMQRRKRIGDLVEAFRRISGEDHGLILVGSDLERCLEDVSDRRIYKFGALYGAELADVLLSSDVYCMPGHVGLGIVDAMHSGLPFVTEDVDHAPEIVYLKHGVNGFMVPAGDITALAEKLQLLLEDEELRSAMGRAARATIASDATIEGMCVGFVEALRHAVQEPASRGAA
jgi:glycosyltransferase involved in cell wall biosynthesis